MDKETYDIILKECARAKARLVVVSKTQTHARIWEYYEVGQRIFGENRVEELVEKYEALPKDIEWHFIGHLQSKKVKKIAPFVSMIHAVDSEKQLLEINKNGEKNERKIPCLLQFHIAEETSKYGLNWNDAHDFLGKIDLAALEGVEIGGVMGMATYTDDDEQIQQEFRSLMEIFKKLKAHFFRNAPHFKEISMGMSGDYPIALEEGSTMVRVGSLLFP